MRYALVSFVRLTVSAAALACFIALPSTALAACDTSTGTHPGAGYTVILQPGQSIKLSPGTGVLVNGECWDAGTCITNVSPTTPVNVTGCALS